MRRREFPGFGCNRIKGNWYDGNMLQNTNGSDTIIFSAFGVLLTLLVSLALWILNSIKADIRSIFAKINHHGEEIEALQAVCEERHARKRK